MRRLSLLLAAAALMGAVSAQETTTDHSGLHVPSYDSSSTAVEQGSTSSRRQLFSFWNMLFLRKCILYVYNFPVQGATESNSLSLFRVVIGSHILSLVTF
jgi:hypothetical protein